MTAIERAVEDAIDGGWRKGHYKMRWGGGRIEQWEYLGNNRSEWTRLIDLSTALLDPNFWRAVGKTRGSEHFWDLEAKTMAEKFFKKIMDDMTIEEALLALEK